MSAGLLLAALLVSPNAPAAPFDAGLVLHYVRSNRDGSLPEHVVHFASSPRDLSVYKWVSKCRTAAYVTARMDRQVVAGELFVAGKVARDGSQARFGTLRLDPGGPALVLDLAPPGGPRLQARHELKRPRYLLYDFDLADLNAFLRIHRPTRSFSFDLPVIWPGEGPRLFEDSGTLRAKSAGLEWRTGRWVRRFDVRVSGARRGSGRLWVDASAHHLVEAELSLPNHREYRDFRLRLDKVEQGGHVAFDALTRGHYQGCATTD